MALANETALYNLALGYVGIENEVASTGETSAEAKLCTRFYETCRKQLVGSYDWPWAHKVLALANGAQVNPAAGAVAALKIYPWSYKYDYPADCLTPRFLLPVNTTPLTGQERIPFEVANYDNALAIFTDENQGTLAAPAVSLAYTMNETTTTVWPIEFDVALALLLAANLAIPLAGEGSLRQTLMDQHRVALAEAVSKSMDMRHRGVEKNNEVELTETRFS
jgi:hypothetical protein